MPIYEYYCSECYGRFRQLAKQINVPAPACPRCGNVKVERMISAVNTLHSSTHHQAELKQKVGNINTQNPAEIAKFLKESGRLEDADGVYGSKSYRELIDRRAAGAADGDLTDLVDDLAAEMRKSVSGEVSGAMLFSDQMENRMAAEGPPDEQNTEINRTDSAPAKHQGEDLGWV